MDDIDMSFISEAYSNGKKVYEDKYKESIYLLKLSNNCLNYARKLIKDDRYHKCYRKINKFLRENK